MADAFLFDAVRTPRGKGFPPRGAKKGGGLHAVPPHGLIGQLIDALIERNGAGLTEQVSRLILGCVGQVGAQGGHIALVSRLASQLPNDVATKTLNNYCVSGLTAVNESVLWARGGEEGLSLAGGVEMASHVPFLADQASYYCDPDLAEKLDHLSPVMGAELIATLERYSKADLDAVTARSHRRAHEAWEEGRYASGVVTAMTPEGRTALERDEWINPSFTEQKLAGLPPAFAALGADGQDARVLKHYPELDAVDHVHSLANMPGFCDGAALTITGSREAGAAAGLAPRAKFVAIAETGGDPILQFGAGFAAMDQVLEKAGVTVKDLDLIEFMEAFAAVPLKFERNYQPDMDKVNVNGGHLAMGHPMGATGAILTTTLLHELERRDQELGMVVTLAANGIGSALIISRDV